MHLVAYLNNRVSDTEIEAAANSAGVVVRAVSRFYEAAPSRSGLMLGFSLQWPRPGLPKELLPSAIMVALTGRISRHQMPPGKGPLMCRFSDAGSEEVSTCSGGRRLKSAEARNRRK